MDVDAINKMKECDINKIISVHFINDILQVIAVYKYVLITYQRLYCDISKKGPFIFFPFEQRKYIRNLLVRKNQ